MIGILGGTFDPIHYGHLRPAQEVMHALQLSEVRVIPVCQPAHRRLPVASPHNRIEMARLACTEFPGFIVDDREVTRGGLSYTVDTLVSLRHDVGEKQPLCLLLGTDAFQHFETWRDWEFIPDLAHVVVMQRPGWTITDGQLPKWARKRLAWTTEELIGHPAGRLFLQLVTPQDISGTDLRAAIKQGELATPWLPLPVREFIRSHNIYRSPTI